MEINKISKIFNKEIFLKIVEEKNKEIKQLKRQLSAAKEDLILFQNGFEPISKEQMQENLEALENL